MDMLEFITLTNTIRKRNMQKIAVILAGCGRMDGSEIHESVLTLLSIQEANATYKCFSLDKEQNHVTNHLTNETSNESRNMLIESARIARGDVSRIEELVVDDFDALIIPGGNGTAYNLFNLATKGVDFSVEHSVADICRQFTDKQKPVGFICIAPAMIPAIYPFPVNLTIGNDKATAELLVKRGAIHHEHKVDEICVDEAHKIVTTPAYMLANNILEAYTGINKLVKKIVALS